MANFDGKLKSNEIFAALFNMIISQQVFADNIKDTKNDENTSESEGYFWANTDRFGG